MKRYNISLFLVFISLLLNNVLKAGDKPLFSNLAFTISGKAGYTKGASFGRMVKSYNTLNAANQTKLKNFGPSTGYCIGIDWIAYNIFMGYYQHRVYATAKSKATDYLTREFTMEQKAWGMDFGGGKMAKKGGLVFYGGIYFSAVNLSAALKYRDGYKSFGADSPANGVYHGFGVTGSIGLKGYRYEGPIGFTYGLRWYHIASNTSLTDFNKSFGTETLSESWTTGGPDVTSKFSSVSLELGIAYQIILIK